MTSLMDRLKLVAKYEVSGISGISSERYLHELHKGDFINAYGSWWEIKRHVELVDDHSELDSVLIELDPGTNLIYMNKELYAKLKYKSMKFEDLVKTWHLDKVLKRNRDPILEFLYHPSRNMARSLVNKAETLSRSVAEIKK